MTLTKFTSLTNITLAEEFNTDLNSGLDDTTAIKLLSTYGPNSLISNKVQWWHILLRQFKSAFVYLLLAAVTISFVLGEYVDGIFILAFVLINAGLGFYQEFKSEQTVNLLKNYVQPKVRVVRNGIEKVIFAKELVPGDLVLLETGDIVPADLRVFHQNDLLVDEAILSGESLPVNKIAEPLDKPVDGIYGATNLLFMGTAVVAGFAKGIVVSTSNSTEIGKISKLTNETTRISGFEKQLNKFSKFILVLILSTLFVVFIAHLLLRHNSVSYVDLALFTIALAVGVVPEGLPLVTTFALSHGAVLLTKKHVVVKRLSAIEDLGSIEILCSDKTGTLTENKMIVSEVYSTDASSTLLHGLLASSLNSDNTRLANNSFDLALKNYATPQIIDKLQNYSKVNEIPFDPKRRRNSYLISSNENKENFLVVRGAAESILPYVNNVNKDEAEKIIAWTFEQGKKGRRVLAIATKNTDIKDTYDVIDEESDLKLSGFISFNDPVKSTTKAAVQKAKELKVAIKILTGDSKQVAGAVAFDVGISDSPDKVLTGDEFEKLSENDRYRAVEDFNVFSRVSPEQKYRIIEMLQKKFRVGYLGEGINDAPALKIANVALAVEGASDIARDAADIVLLQQNLQVIIDGIEEGRKTFVNTVKYIKSTLTSNFGNFYSVAFASLLIDFLPMLPIQILLVNLLSDFPMISIATDEVEPDELKNPRNYDVREIIIVATILGTVSSLFDFIFFAVFKNLGEPVLQTNWFIGSILTELLLIYSIRTKKAFFRAKSLPSKQVTVLTIVAGILTVLIPFTAFGASMFKFTPPSQPQILLIGLIVLCYFAATEIAKLMYYKGIDSTKI